MEVFLRWNFSILIYVGIRMAVSGKCLPFGAYKEVLLVALSFEKYNVLKAGHLDV